MNAVGIDVSKGKSMVAALRPMGEVALLPQEFLHTEVGLEQMAYAILALGEDTRVVMEATGRYHEPVAAALHEYGIYVCVLNPLYIKQSGGGSIRFHFLSQFYSHLNPDLMLFRVCIGIGIQVKSDDFKPVPAVKRYGVFIAGLGFQNHHAGF